MKKETVISCVLVGCAFVLSACQEVPDEVRENMAQYGKNEYVDEKEMSFCSVEDLRKSSMDDIAAERENIKLPSYVDFSKVDEVGEPTFKFVENYSEYMPYYCEQFGIDYGLETDYSGGLSGDYGKTTDDTAKRKYLYVSDGGEISYLSSYFYYDGADMNDSTSDIEKIYLKRGDKAEKLSQMVSFAEKESKKIIKGIDGLDTEVRTVQLAQGKDGREYALMNLELTYKGIILDFFGGQVDITGDNQACVSNMENYINMGLSDTNEICQLSINGVFEVEEYKEAEKIIDFQTAVNIFEHEMASFNEVDVCEIEPVYMLEPVYDADGGEYYAKGGNEVKAVPVYSFLIKNGDDVQNIGILEGNELVYFNVNMLTGEIYTNFDNKGYGILGEQLNDSQN